MEKHYAYIIFSDTLNQFYKGSTKNIDERIARHNAKREKATKAGAPWKLIWYTEKESKAEAIKLEFKLKNLSRKRLIEFMLKYKQDIASQNELLFLKQLL